MLIAPGKGFVFLAIPKTGTSAIERAFRRHSDGSFVRNPFKHIRYDEFQKHVQPFLKAKGYPRESYEVVCIAREPVDWLFSWWKYRSREDLTDPGARGHRNFSGHVEFEEFAQIYMRLHRGEKPTKQTRFANLGRPTRFVRPQRGEPGVDRIFRYDRIDLLVDFLSAKVGERVNVKARNVSPKRSFTLTPETERDLRAFFEPEYQLYENAIADPVAPVGAVPKRRRRFIGRR